MLTKFLQSYMVVIKRLKTSLFHTTKFGKHKGMKVFTLTS
ncbi:UNVERIFIED_CONTAM: hypothetical protein GTU68_061339 [Idotea baltica]|nr:hypothetical protein [Idotea baltica]